MRRADEGPTTRRLPHDPGYARRRVAFLAGARARPGSVPGAVVMVDMLLRAVTRAADPSYNAVDGSGAAQRRGAVGALPRRPAGVRRVLPPPRALGARLLSPAGLRRRGRV